MSNNNFSGATFTGNNLIGDNNTQNNTYNDLQQITTLLATLRTQIQQAPIPAETKASLEEHVDSMKQAAQSPDPKSGFSQDLTGINDKLKQVGTATESVSGIVSTISKIATIAGIGIKTVAPFIAGLL
jgi:hypothetical protein